MIDFSKEPPKDKEKEAEKEKDGERERQKEKEKEQERQKKADKEKKKLEEERVSQTTSPAMPETASTACWLPDPPEGCPSCTSQRAEVCVCVCV